jgi:hypothetical protein
MASAQRVKHKNGILSPEIRWVEWWDEPGPVFYSEATVAALKKTQKFSIFDVAGYQSQIIDKTKQPADALQWVGHWRTIIRVDIDVKWKTGTITKDLSEANLTFSSGAPTEKGVVK